jgi:hypothetical protein
MATKKEGAVLRGAKLMKKAIESAKASGVLASPEPIEPASLARKLKLPNGEPISPAMKELLAFDAAWLGIGYDDEEAEAEGVSLDDVVEEHFGEEAVACLYVGEPDEAGEYPVLQMTFQDGVARIGGFVPFDVWAAQELGALERGKDIGDVPEAYAALVQAAADENGDGRVVFTPKAGEAREDDHDDEGQDDDEESDASEEGEESEAGKDDGDD